MMMKRRGKVDTFRKYKNVPAWLNMKMTCRDRILCDVQNFSAARGPLDPPQDQLRIRR